MGGATVMQNGVPQCIAEASDARSGWRLSRAPAAILLMVFAWSFQCDALPESARQTIIALACAMAVSGDNDGDNSLGRADRITSKPRAIPCCSASPWLRSPEAQYSRGAAAAPQCRKDCEDMSLNHIVKSSRRLTSVLIYGVLCVAAVLTMAACAWRDRAGEATQQVSFDDYRRATVHMLAQRRVFQNGDWLSELNWNAPAEWRPAGPPRKGALLVHGLGDSPWSFNDIGRQLAAEGFLVRTVLLPGHGTRPEDLLDVTLEDWRGAVAEQAHAMSREVDEVYLGGFSTGGNLVVDYAYANPGIAGLLLFSPAFMSSSPYDWLTPLISWARPWLQELDGRRPMQNAVRYMTVPTNGFAQFYRSSRLARHALRQGPYDKPVLMVVAEHDSVLDTRYLLDIFSTRFTHPGSRLIWYGDDHGQHLADSRVLVRSDRLPASRISQFSHMGLLFSPDNALYGKNGAIRLCWNGQSDAAREACEEGAPVWFSDWGYQEAGKIHARLTFNPYFEWQKEVMIQVLNEPSTR
jgi:esterase/lipase